MNMQAVNVTTPIQPDQVPDKLIALCQAILKKNVDDDNTNNNKRNNKRNKLASRDLLSLMVHTHHSYTITPLLLKTIGRLLTHTHAYDADVGASLVLTLCDRVCFHSDGDGDAGVSAEEEDYEKLCNAAPAWLTQLLLNMEEGLRSVGCENYYFGLNLLGNKEEEDDSFGIDVDDASIICYLQAAIALVSTCKHKVRSGGTTTETMEKLQKVSWSIMGSKRCRPDLMMEAARFSAIVPILGQQSSQPPAVIWSELIFSSLAALSVCLHAAWPNKSISRSDSSSSIDWAIKDGIGDGDQWLVRFKPTVIDQERRKIFILHRIEALTKLITALLELRGYERQKSEIALKLGEYPLTRSLQTCELMVKFGSRAEGKCLSTSGIKNELSGASALLSPVSVVSILPSVRSFGLELLSSILTATKVSLLPYSKEVISLVEYSLETASSTAVQNQAKTFYLSSSSVEQWLNRSVEVRTRAINLLNAAVLSLGCSIIPRVEKCLSLITAHLLEQSIMKEQTYENGGDWSSTEDRINLIEVSCQSLAISLNSGGSFISLECRSSIDIVLNSCLTHIFQNCTAPHLLFSRSKLSVLKLARASICAPWQDGSYGILGPRIRSTAIKLKTDRDPNVVSSAIEIICLCDALLLPRSVPFVVATRAVEKSTLTHHTSLMQNMEQSRNDIAAVMEQSRNDIAAVKKQKQNYSEGSLIDVGSKRRIEEDNHLTNNNSDKTNDRKSNLAMDIDEGIDQVSNISIDSEHPTTDELIGIDRAGEVEVDKSSVSTKGADSGNDKKSDPEFINDKSQSIIEISPLLENSNNMQDSQDNDSDSCPDICIDDEDD